MPVKVGDSPIFSALLSVTEAPINGSLLFVSHCAGDCYLLSRGCKSDAAAKEEGLKGSFVMVDWFIKVLRDYFFADGAALDHHSGNVERALEEVSFGWLCNSAVPVEIAEPFSKFPIREMIISPFVYPVVHIEIFGVSGGFISV